MGMRAVGLGREEARVLAREKARLVRRITIRLNTEQLQNYYA